MSVQVVDLDTLTKELKELGKSLFTQTENTVEWIFVSLLRASLCTFFFLHRDSFCIFYGGNRKMRGFGRAAVSRAANTGAREFETLGHQIETKF